MPISEQICLKLIYTVFIQYTQTKKRRQCMHLQSYMYSFTKLQLKKVDSVCVRVRMRACVYQILASFSSLWEAVRLCKSTHCQFNESVNRKEEHTS